MSKIPSDDPRWKAVSREPSILLNQALTELEASRRDGLRMLEGLHGLKQDVWHAMTLVQKLEHRDRTKQYEEPLEAALAASDAITKAILDFEGALDKCSRAKYEIDISLRSSRPNMLVAR